MSARGPSFVTTHTTIRKVGKIESDFIFKPLEKAFLLVFVKAGLLLQYHAAQLCEEIEEIEQETGPQIDLRPPSALQRRPKKFRISLSRKTLND